MSFTAYPPGHYPYGQVPLVDLGLDGSDLSLEEGDDPLTGTLLQAAGDAGRGELWVRQGAPIPPDAVRSTQRRRLFGVAALLGLVVASASASQSLGLELVAEVAQVPASLLFASSAALKKTRGLETWGRQIKVVLERPLAQRGSWLADRLATLGFLAGRWGRPYRWTCDAGGRLIQLGKPFWSARSRDGP
ncbi:MAG: hypothetical protein JKY65_24320 [Planctomycetes bacterium]|nr:hypothetical protein [Planctomycetota bacterium]